MKLHYSQTYNAGLTGFVWFYYLMKLHYSQTLLMLLNISAPVLLPYEITLFSNEYRAYTRYLYVLLPYEITLFSNNLAIEIS